MWAAENLNDISLVTLFEAPGLRCLSSGDGERPWRTRCWQAARMYMRMFSSGASRLVQSNTRHFWMRCARRPLWSPAERAIHGHPHSEALAAFANVGGAGLPYRYGGNNHCVCRQGGVLQMVVKRQGGGVMYYSVDALENGTARLVDDAGGSAFVPAQTCRPVRRRGMLEQRDGVWSAAPEETKRRTRAALLCSRYWA